MADPITIEVLGEHLPVTLPDFATREELVLAWDEARKRGGLQALHVYAAALGLCTRIGRWSEVDYQKSGYNVLAYGRAVYSKLRTEKKLPPDKLAQAGVKLIDLLAEGLFPSDAEAEEAAKN